MTRNVALVFVFMALLFFVPANAQSNKSISIDGHTFTAKLDDNWTANQANVIDYNPQNPRGGEMNDPRVTFSSDPVPGRAIDWTGYQALDAFYYRTTQSLESIAKYGLTKYGFIDIRVLKLTKDYIDAYSPTPDDTLRHALPPGKVFSTKFNGKPAFHSDYPGREILVYLIDNDTVALIDVETRNVGVFAPYIIRDMTVE